MRIFKKYDFLFINKNYEFFFGLWLFKAEHFHWVKIYIFLQLKLDLKKKYPVTLIYYTIFFFHGMSVNIASLKFGELPVGF